ncbi:hypothetical protein I4F81_000543 [Pyropia yezoensis]|uniref:Uncharacterized protein n=1 Tax=Pyropia yezoensis TaxID=2788 RepID=A0ACC3BIY5_PYRYE|nr:hypothetical protein I4F81_000543 [Neopyropia yezoensis]
MMLPGGGGGVFNGGPGGGGASNGGPGGGASVPSSSREPLGSADLADLASRLPVVTPDDDGVLEATLPHDDPASVVAWAPDEATLLTAGGDAVVRLWDVATGALVRSYVGHDGMVTAAAWLPSGTQFASGGMDGHVLVWDVATGALVHTLPHQERVSDVAVSANGRWVVASFADKMPGGSVQEWDIASGVLTRTFEGQQQSRYVIRSAFGGHRDGWVVSGSEDSTVLLWHRETTRLVGRLYGHSGSVNCAAWSPAHDALVASASDDGTLWLWTSKRAVDAAVGVGGVTPVPVTAFERAADLNPLGGGGRRGGGGDGGEGAAGGGRGGDATGTAGAQSQLVGLPTTATASAGSSRRAVGTSGRRRPLWGASRGYGASVADVMARARAAAGASVTSRFVLP